MVWRAIAVTALVAGCLCTAQAQWSSKERLKAFSKLPDWSGLWEFDAYVGEGAGQVLSAEGLRKARAYAAAMRPSFTSSWQPKVDAARKAQAAAIAADPYQPPGFSGCAALPFPATMMPGFYEWRVTPEEATLMSSQLSVRHIYTDGRSHPPADELWPTTMGNSVGHWEGDTLVVDTISMRFPVIIVVAEPFEPSFSTGPLSPELHATERIRMVNHDEMQIQLTAEDPIALAKPIKMTITWERVKDFDRMEDTRDASCDPTTDRNPVVNGRFTTIVNPSARTPAEPKK